MLKKVVLAKFNMPQKDLVTRLLFYQKSNLRYGEMHGGYYLIFP